MRLADGWTEEVCPRCGTVGWLQPREVFEEFYTPNQVAEMMKVSPYTVRKWLREGVVTGVKIGSGKAWRISRTEVLKMTKERFG